MSGQGMIVRERAAAALTAAIREQLERTPRGQWTSLDDLTDSLTVLERRADGRFEIVTLGVTVSENDVRDAARSVIQAAPLGA